MIVYLKRDVAYLLNRTSGDKNRPSLSDDVSFQTPHGAKGAVVLPRGGLHRRRLRRGGGIGGEVEERDQGGSVGVLLRGDRGGTARTGSGGGGEIEMRRVRGVGR